MVHAALRRAPGPNQRAGQRAGQRAEGYCCGGTAPHSSAALEGKLLAPPERRPSCLAPGQWREPRRRPGPGRTAVAAGRDCTARRVSQLAAARLVAGLRALAGVVRARMRVVPAPAGVHSVQPRPFSSMASSYQASADLRWTERPAGQQHSQAAPPVGPGEQAARRGPRGAASQQGCWRGKGCWQGKGCWRLPLEQYCQRPARGGGRGLARGQVRRLVRRLCHPHARRLAKVCPS